MTKKKPAEFYSSVGVKECKEHEHSIEFEILVDGFFGIFSRELYCTGDRQTHLIRHL